MAIHGHDKENWLKVRDAVAVMLLRLAYRAAEIYREFSGARISGGSEDVMFNLAVRQPVKQHTKALSEAKRASSKHL
jgi:hypothetical protein